jgi:hypothetical protein
MKYSFMHSADLHTCNLGQPLLPADCDLHAIRIQNSLISGSQIFTRQLTRRSSGTVLGKWPFV